MNLDFRSERALEGARAFGAARHSAHQCGECRDAQLYAVQDRAECVAAGTEHFARVIMATHPACRHFASRPATDTTMAGYLAQAGRRLVTDIGPVPDFPAVKTAAEPVVAARWVALPRTMSLH